MRGLDDYYKSKYFKQDGSVWDLDPKIRDSVKFQTFNLQNSFLFLGRFDVIFCRYVMIYFSDELKKEIIKKINDALLTGGVVFTGNYTLLDMFDEVYTTNHFENITYYTK